MDEFLKGEKLYGDDFSESQIREWYEDEKEASETLRGDYINRKVSTENNFKHYYYGFNFFKDKNIDKVLSIGGAYGDELLPILEKIKGEIFVIESSEVVINKQNQQDKFKYLLAETSGKIKLDDNFIDLITCFDVLHHIPNVSYVVSELFRVLKPGGFILISEPIVSMGDWSVPGTRGGLTKRERGIPIKIFDKILQDVGFIFIKRKLCVFSPFHLFFARILKKEPYNNKILVIFDDIFSKLFSFRVKYYRKNFFDKLSPSCVFYVLRKPD